MPGHCLIVPVEHVASARQVDEHVWTEIRNFKKCLLQMFMAQVCPYPLSMLPWLSQWSHDAAGDSAKQFLE